MAGRPKKIENFFKAPKSTTKFTTRGGQSRGILDEHPIKKSIKVKEGSVEKYPIKLNDVVNLAALKKIGVEELPIHLFTEVDEILTTYTGELVTTIVWKFETVTTATINITYDANNFTSIVTVTTDLDGTETYTFSYTLDTRGRVIEKSYIKT